MPRKQDGPRSRHTVTVYLNDSEWIEIARKAKAAGRSQSRYLRDATLGRKMLSMMDIETLRELKHLRADLARLGNLFKGYRFGDEAVDEALEDILQGISLRNGVMRDLIAELNERLFGKPK